MSRRLWNESAHPGVTFLHATRVPSSPALPAGLKVPLLAEAAGLAAVPAFLVTRRLASPDERITLERPGAVIRQYAGVALMRRLVGVAQLLLT